MDSGHSVRAVRADDCQVSHADLALVALFHEAHTLHATLVTRETKANFVQQTPVNFVNDLQMPGKKYLKPRNRPFLQSFGKKRVVCVGERLLSKFPRLIPSQAGVVQ